MLQFLKTSIAYLLVNRRDFFRLKNPWALSLWLSLVVLLALFVDREVILAVSNAPGWVYWFGDLVEPFGDSGYPILGGALACFFLTMLAVTAGKGLEKRVLWSLSQLAAFISLSTFWSGLVILILKRIIGRPRPIKWLETGMYDWLPLQFQHLHVSMPSGHTTTVFTLAFLGWVLLPRFRWVIVLLASLVALGRVMIQYHWPSDLIIGALVGWLLARQVARFFVGNQGLFVLKRNGDFAANPFWQGYAEAFTRMLRS